MIGSVILAIVVFAFVLEPVLRARGDRVVLDDVATPQAHLSPDDDQSQTPDRFEVEELVGEDRPPRRPVSVERPLRGDLA